MATITLNDVVRSQDETNEKLDNINERFRDFFKQVAADKLDMLEMMRELRSSSETKPASGADTTPEQSKGVEDSKASLFSLAGALGLVAANSLGLVSSFSKLKEGFTSLSERAGKLKTSVGTALANVGTKISEWGKGVASSLSEKLKSFTSGIAEKARGVGSAISEKAKSISTKAQSVGTAIVDKAKGVTSAVRNFVSPETTKSGRQLGEVFVDKAGRKQQIVKNAAGKLVSQLTSQDAKVGKPTSLASIGSSIAEKTKNVGTAIADSKVGRFGAVALKGLSKAAAPLAVATSAFEGYKMATEEGSEGLSTAGKVAVGAGGAASAFFGGFADFIKLVTIDAAIEAGQKLGAISEDGYLQRVQDASIQKDITDRLVRGARDTLRSDITNKVAEGTADSMKTGSTIIVNNVNAPNTTQNNVSTSTNDVPLPSSTNSGTTRTDAWA